MNSKYWKYTDGTARWKYDSPFENWLSRRADESEWMKALYVGFYRLIDGSFYRGGLPFIDREIANFQQLGGTLPWPRKRIVRDMVYSLHRFGAMFNEYFRYEFYLKNAAGRDEYICDKARYDYYRRMNRTENLPIFDDKGKTYQYFGAFYGREVLAVESAAQKADFAAFVCRHASVMIKPLGSSGGRNIRKLTIAPEAADTFFDETLAKGPFIAEEVIVQAPELAQFHPASLNTVRLPTITVGEEVHVFGPFLRLGTGGSVVDNAFAGGCFACIDEETGIVSSPACSKSGQVFLKHPDTDLPIIGFRLPEWDKAVALAAQLAAVVPDNHYAAWDLAYSDKGWVMVEGNARGEFVMQMPDKVGRKRRLLALIQRIEQEN